MRGRVAPSTSSLLSYMGDESTSLPPAAKKPRSTSARTARAAASAPASKASQVPRPMAGSFSPLAGIVRSRRAAGTCASGPAPNPHAAPAARNRSHSRRSMLHSSKPR